MRLLPAAALAALLAVPLQAAAAQNTHSVPLFMRDQGGSAQQGFVRIANLSSRNGIVEILAYDDHGWEYGPVSLPLAAGQTKGLNSSDLENGGTKGLSHGIGRGIGDWRLELYTDLNIQVRAYVRNPSPGGWFVTAMHDAAPVSIRGPGRYQVPFLNPASNTAIASRLRIANPHNDEVAVTIEGRDDQGRDGLDSVRLTVPPQAARTLTAQALEGGGASLGGYPFDGALGDGDGKWRLSVTSTRPLHVMSLLDTSSGHLANLSTAPPSGAVAARKAFDADGDGLIEVFFLEQLDAIRHDLDGNGRVDNSNDHDAYAAAFPDAAPGEYRGYELARPLDFTDPGSYASGEVNDDWVRGDRRFASAKGWEPIGEASGRFFHTAFDGNGHALSNLFIHRVEESYVGLFGRVGIQSDGLRPGEVRNLGLVDVDVTGQSNVGALVGYLDVGLVRACYIAGGNVAGSENSVGGLVGTMTELLGTRIVASYADVDVTGYDYIGGLVGDSLGAIFASYAFGLVEGKGHSIGGLVGRLTSLGSIRASYAVGKVQGPEDVGGLVGERRSGADIRSSYWNTDTAGDTGVGSGDTSGAQGRTTEELTAPTGYEGIYADWNLDLDKDGEPDDPWDFGNNRQYPALKVDFDGDGMATWQEFGEQPR